MAFKKLYPGDWFEGLAIPFVEDLVNQHPLDLYIRWRHQQGLDMEGSWNPVLAVPSVRQKMRTAEGQQVGAINHRAALAPLLPFHLQPDQHFERALQLSVQPLPTEGLPLLDDDLRFAASFSSLPGVDLSKLRKRAMGLLAEMKRRWSKITEHLRTKQTEAIRTATAQRDIGLHSHPVAVSQLGRCDAAGRPLHGAARSGIRTPLRHIPRAGGIPLDTGRCPS